MTIEIKVPESGESVTDVEIGEWLKSEGDPVERDESVVVLETDKASMELPAPSDGVLSEVLKEAGETVQIGDVIGKISPNGAAARRSGAAEGKAEDEETQPPSEKDEKDEKDEQETKEEETEAKEDEKEEPEDEEDGRGRRKPRAADEEPEGDARRTPGPREEGTDGEPDEERGDRSERAPARPVTIEPASDEDEEVVPMSLLRRGIAKRLVEAQREAALLTTFNEIDVTELRALRSRWGDVFEARHGVSLGIMSLFVKASIEALKDVPELNAEVRGTEIVYHRRFHIGIAVGGDRGLVVPVLRDADLMSLAEIDEAIDDFVSRAGRDELELDELQGGTFTITNGGIFGSLLSTPIVNPPQSGVLGMHAIQERPVARGGEVVIRPMMYVALTYDHRLIDGRGAVGFLRRIKEIVESPERLLLEA